MSLGFNAPVAWPHPQGLGEQDIELLAGPKEE